WTNHFVHGISDDIGVIREARPLGPSRGSRARHSLLTAQASDEERLSTVSVQASLSSQNSARERSTRYPQKEGRPKSQKSQTLVEMAHRRRSTAFADVPQYFEEADSESEEIAPADITDHSQHATDYLPLLKPEKSPGVRQDRHPKAISPPRA